MRDVAQSQFRVSWSSHGNEYMQCRRHCQAMVGEHFDPNLRNFPTNVDTVTKCNAKLKAKGLYSNDVCVDDE